ncbi:MAG: FHA domain-containing protein [Gemmataceae bacterium]
MKVSLVVASGVHQGKVVPIIGPQFLVGRDPQCQLRPASQAVSKQHCAVIVRDGKVYLKDFGSTNGTTLNEVVVQGEERLLHNNDSVKIGPLDFFIRIEAEAAKPDGTPLPDLNPESAAALAAVKAVSKPSISRNPTPAPGSRETPPAKSKAATGEDAEQDRLAAMLLGLDDGEVPGGSTVVDVPVPAGVTESGEKPAEKPAEKKGAVPSREDTSSAASEILRKYMRRPK